MKLGAAIAEIMKREGIQVLTGYPVNHLIEFAAAIDIRPIMVRQERIGLHMADGISRVTSGRTIGAFCMQHGPGSENAYGGVAQCYGESIPVLVLPMGYPRRLAHIDPNFNSSVQMRGITKSAEPIMSAAEVPNILRRAFSKLRNGRGGPVLVEIPTDMWNEEVPEPLAYTPVIATRYGPDPGDVSRAADALVAAKRPVIYAGTGVHWARAWPQLKALAELLAAPVTTSLGGKSSFPEDHPLALGSGGLAIPKPVRHFLDTADLILGIGCSFTETNFGVKMPAGKKIIHATLDPDHLNKDVACEIGLVGDAGLTLDALLAEIAGRLRTKRDAAPPRSRSTAPNGSPPGRRRPTATPSRSTPIACCATCGARWTSTTPSSPTMPAARAISYPRSGSRARRCPIWAGARPRSSATGWGSRWARSSPRPTSCASMSGVMPQSASRAWISRPRCASASRSCPSC